MIGQQLFAQAGAPSVGTRTELATDIRDARLLDVSPDGKRLCLCSSRRPLSSAVFVSPGNRAYRSEPGEASLHVVDIESGSTVYSKQISGGIGTAGFFSGGKRLYFETSFPGVTTYRQIILDLPTGVLTERSAVRNGNKNNYEYTALDDNALLGIEVSPNPYLIQSLLRVGSDDLHEIARVPYAPTDVRGPGNRDTSPVISSDRKKVAYGVSSSLVVRRTNNLELIWATPIEPGYFGIRRLSLTPDGSIVAVSVVDTTAYEHQRKYYISICDSEKRVQIARLPVNGSEGIGISPNGQILAVGKRIIEGRDIRLGIELYQVGSGKMIAQSEHDRIPPGRYQSLVASFDVDGVRFTSDGKYLITSGNNHVKLWNAHSLTN